MGVPAQFTFLCGNFLLNFLLDFLCYYTLVFLCGNFLWNFLLDFLCYYTLVFLCGTSCCGGFYMVPIPLSYALIQQGKGGGMGGDDGDLCPHHFLIVTENENEWKFYRY